ncbi:hypothetical protein EW145_g6574 [Phellinidium pouzarii]|uniref:Uncharacterized protein n=1 Tax=Phellinidium pouzarii TaxID=167371 RepID=A0A4S4KWQ0_9AGAM|nr:hypothetical protein EW145_g6574 [Phellinidium pouzarii]
MTTIATFFSAVTATALQMSYQDNANSIAIATNALLLSSIVLSVASAISSLLTMAWHGSVVRQPEQILPGWADAWLKKWPIVSLSISGSLFFGALCCFVVSTSQHLVTRLLTYTFVSFNAICLICLTIWITFEEWKVRRLSGSSGKDMTENSLTLNVIDKLESTIRFTSFGRSKNDGRKGVSDNGNTYLSFNGYGYKPDYDLNYEQIVPLTYTQGQDLTSHDNMTVVNPWILPLQRADTPGAILIQNNAPPAEYSIPVVAESDPRLPQIQHTSRPFMSATGGVLPRQYMLPGVNPIPGVTEWLRPSVQHAADNSYILPQKNDNPHNSG